jgi:hypothetical protein
VSQKALEGMRSYVGAVNARGWAWPDIEALALSLGLWHRGVRIAILWSDDAAGG